MRRLRWKLKVEPAIEDTLFQSMKRLPGVWSRDKSRRTVWATFDIGQHVSSVLRYMGYRVTLDPPVQPLPVPDNLDAWPHLDLPEGFSPKSYQRDGVRFLLERGGGIAKWPCGTGKTFLGILFLCGCIARQEGDKIIIVTRGSTTSQWASALSMFTTFEEGRDYMVIRGFSSYRIQESAPPKTIPYYRAIKSLEAYEGRQTQATVEAYTYAQQQVDRSEVPPKRRVQIKKLVEAGVVQECHRVEKIEDWAPLCLYCDDTKQVEGYFGIHSPVVAVSGRLDEWKECYLSPDQPMTTRRIAYMLWWCATHYEDTERTELLAIISEQLASEGSEDPDKEARNWLQQVVSRYAAEKALEEANRKLVVSEGVRILIVGWPVLTSRVDALSSFQADTLIIDESHNAKGTSHYRMIPDPFTGKPDFIRKENAAASANHLARFPSIKNVLELSATPSPDRVRDYWSQMKMLDPKIGSFRPFSTRYCNGHQGEYGWDSTGSSSEEELSLRLSNIMHVVSEEQASKELPDLKVSVVFLDPMDQAKVSIDARSERGLKKQGSSAILQHRLEVAALTKTPYLVQAVTEAVNSYGEKCTILTSRTSHAQELHKRLCGKMDPAKVLLGTGEDTDQEDRQGLVQQLLNMTEGGVLIGTNEAWKEGIDGLQYTDRAWIAALPWNLVLEQLLGRFRRLGGKGTTVELLVSRETIDERVLNIIMPKIQAISETTPRPADGGSLATDKVRDVLEQAVTEGDDDRMEDLAAKVLQGYVSGGEDGEDDL